MCSTDRVTYGPICGGGVVFATQTVLHMVLSVGVGWGLQHRPCYIWSYLWGWGGVCNTDRVTYGPICGGGVGFATQTVLHMVLSVGVGWGLQHRPCYIWSYLWGWGGVCNTDRVTYGPICGGGVGFATQTVLHMVLSVGVGWGLQHRPCYIWSYLWGWGGVCNTDRVTYRPVCRGGEGFATQTMLHIVLSVGVGWVLQHRLCYIPSCLWGWGGFCNTDRVTYRPVCRGGVGFATQTMLHTVLSVGVGWVLQHRPCYIPSCLWGWGGFCNTDRVTYRPVYGGGVGFATQTVLHTVLSVGVGWGLQHIPCYIPSCVWGWGGFCNTDRVTYRPVCGGGVGFATQTVLHTVLSVGVG